MRNVHAIKKRCCIYMISMSRPIYVDSRSANKNETKYPWLPRNQLALKSGCDYCACVRRYNHSLSRHFNVRIRHIHVYSIYMHRHTHLINYYIFTNHVHFNTHSHGSRHRPSEIDRQNKTDIETKRKKAPARSKLCHFSVALLKLLPTSFSVFLWLLGSFIRSIVGLVCFKLSFSL